jgi:hypothetical protein
MYTVRNGEDLQRGDLIAIAGERHIELGIYYGRGTGGTVQYYSIGSAPGFEYRHNERTKSLGAEKVGPFKLNHIWKSYVNSPSAWRFMKLYKNKIQYFHKCINKLYIRYIKHY